MNLASLMVKVFCKLTLVLNESIFKHKSIAILEHQETKNFKDSIYNFFQPSNFSKIFLEDFFHSQKVR